MRRLAVLALLVGAAAAGAWLACAARERPRNLVLLSIDTLRRDRLGAYGYDRPTSPVLDALAARGVVFEGASAPSSWTVPSHGSLLTGLSPQAHGATGAVQRLDPRAETLAGWLRQHGYATAAVVNTVLLSAKRGFAGGFDHFELVLGPEPAAPEIHARALRWLDGARERRPFFLFLHYYDVHSDYAPAPAYRELLVSPYRGPADGTTEQLKAARLGRLSLAPDDARHLSELYDAEIRQLDDELGRFFAALEERGLLADTAIVVTSDHGEEFGEHGGVLHGRTLYGELVDVPLILAGPGVPAGRRVSGPASLLDVFPTVTALLGVPAPPYVEGTDLWSDGALRPPAARPLFFATDWWLGRADGEWKRAVERDGWKLHVAHPGAAAELYDLGADPGERRNVAADEPARVEALRGLLAPLLGPARGGAEGPKLSAEETEALRSLGYLE
ncbi:MAG TPA: sulfatase [Myxococcota bacterium]|nr:sulfatase [Myxococcota bacterium]